MEIEKQKEGNDVRQGKGDMGVKEKEIGIKREKYERTNGKRMREGTRNCK